MNSVYLTNVFDLCILRLTDPNVKKDFWSYLSYPCKIKLSNLIKPIMVYILTSKLDCAVAGVEVMVVVKCGKAHSIVSRK